MGHLPRRMGAETVRSKDPRVVVRGSRIRCLVFVSLEKHNGVFSNRFYD